MRRRWIAVTLTTLAAALAAGGPAAAQPPCDPGPCVRDVLIEKVEDVTGGSVEETVDRVMWAVRCAGYALGGNPCY